jgi:hypothetical protein
MSEESGFAKGRNPNSLANLKPFQPGETSVKRGKKTGTQTKTIIRELLDCDSYADLVQNKGLIQELEGKFDNEKLSGKQLIVVAQICKALKGDTGAFTALLDRLDGKPVQYNENVNTDMNYMDFIKRLSDGQWRDDEE